MEVVDIFVVIRTGGPPANRKYTVMEWNPQDEVYVPIAWCGTDGSKAHQICLALREQDRRKRIPQDAFPPHEPWHVKLMDNHEPEKDIEGVWCCHEHEQAWRAQSP